MKELNAGLELLKKINSYGYEAYFIGGFVRDYLLNIPSNDIDITTSMTIEEIKSKFNIIDNGSTYSSLTISFDSFLFEVTHFRKDSLYLDHRHPVVMDIDTLEEDVKRRDFTINAIAMDKDYKLYDFYSGIEDLKLKRIKTIREPNERFIEDSLRILRGCYFSSKLGFEIENETLMAMNKQRALLKNLSNERIYSYFIKLVYAKTKKGIDYIINNNLFEYIPEYQKWLLIADEKYNETELRYLYAKEYLTYPPFLTKKEKKICDILIDLIRNNFSSYYLYIYKNEIKLFQNILNNYNEINTRIMEFPIKNDSELALKKEEIAQMFKGPEINIKIKEIIALILDRRIENDKEIIKKYLGEM